MSKRRWGWIYAYRVVHPDQWPSGDVVCGYVGQTRDLRRRDREHRDEQPWADTIVGEVCVLEQGWYTDAELDALEQFHIRRMLPLYNIEYNLDNPYRVPPWTAREQAVARGRVLDVQPTRRPPERVPAPRPAPWWVRRLRGFALRLACWVIVAAAVWIWLAVTDRVDGVREGASTGAIAAFGLAMLLRWVQAKLRRTKRQVRRRVKRALR